MGIFLLCYLNTLLTFRGASAKALIRFNLVLSLLIGLFSVLVMYLWLTWIDLIYPLLANWLFLLILITWTRISRRKITAMQPQTPDSTLIGPGSTLPSELNF
jgi:hypothetical protein